MPAAPRRRRSRAVRIEQIAGLAPVCADLGGGLGLGSPRSASNSRADARQRLRRDLEAPGLLQRLHQPAHRRARPRSCTSNSSRSKFEEIWMSIEGEVVASTPRIS